MKPISQFETSIEPTPRTMMQLPALIADLRQVVCNLQISIEHEEDRQQIFLARQLKGRRDNLLLTISAGKPFERPHKPARRSSVSYALAALRDPRRSIVPKCKSVCPRRLSPAVSIHLSSFASVAFPGCLGGSWNAYPSSPQTAS